MKSEIFLNRVKDESCSLADIIELLKTDLGLAQVRDSDGNCAIHYAVLSGDQAKIELFSKEQVMLGFADGEEIIATTPGINAVNNAGQTPLHILMKDEMSGVATLKYMVDDLGADINAVDKDGNSVMHYAIIYGKDMLQDIHRMAIVGCLGYEMREFNHANNAGDTPLSLASGFDNNDDIVKFLSCPEHIFSPNSVSALGSSFREEVDSDADTPGCDDRKSGVRLPSIGGR